ncbi:hypothetical protein D3C76_832420 [compost metagenome]
MLHGELQLVLGALQLGFKLGQHTVLDLVTGTFRDAHHRFDLIEQHQQVIDVGRALTEGAHDHVDKEVAPIAAQAHPARLDALARLVGLEDRRA